MNPGTPAPVAVRRPLLEDFSLEMTAKDGPRLEEARALVPAGTRVNVTFLGNEDLELRLAAARTAGRLGYVPVPHVSARRLASREALEKLLAGLRADGTGGSLLVVGGDPATPHGPYPDALAVVRTGLLAEYGVRHVEIAGYPEGHPAIGDRALFSALADKRAALAEQGLTTGVTTQFGFDADLVLDWIERIRDRGLHVPVRVGVPGPAGARRLVAYAARFGVGTSASIARKYGFSLTHLMGTAGPDRFLHTLAEGYDPGRHGEVKVHFYTFGGLRATSEWIAAF
ncbi:methylenetetrahydrofolate reductase [Streptomyces sp. NPDC096080]|uniref:methylenetetrahydrofolate reductase n=1 Tax=Streptomyces sp. NPDC096080 TaxID=3156693 RepID=UPI0033260FAF